MFYVYIHRKKSNGEIFYVGKGKGDRAWKRDRNNQIWRRIADKHGYTVELVAENLQEHAAFSMERELIALYGRMNAVRAGTLANLTDGGEGSSGATRSIETKKKIAEFNTGKTLSDETKAKIAASKQGIPRTPDVRVKLSAAMSGENNPNFGRKFPPEVRLKMSASRKGKCSPSHPWKGKTGADHNSSKPVICVETGTRYASITDASRLTGAGRSGISSAISGRQSKAGGFSWKYA